MIFTIAFFLLATFINVSVSLLPTGSPFPPEIAAGMTTIWSNLKGWDFLLPIDTILQALIVAFFFWSFVLVWRLVHWVLRKIPLTNIT